MIDWRHQGKGYGRAVINQLLTLFRVHLQAKEVATSYHVDNARAGDLYRSCGFVKVGIEGTEMTVWQTLHPQPVPWTSLWNIAYVYRAE